MDNLSNSLIDSRCLGLAKHIKDLLIASLFGVFFSSIGVSKKVYGCIMYDLDSFDILCSYLQLNVLFLI